VNNVDVIDQAEKPMMDLSVMKTWFSARKNALPIGNVNIKRAHLKKRETTAMVAATASGAKFSAFR
jgi:hypothetical protein